MHLLGRDKLGPLKGLNAALDTWVVSWVSELAHASWNNPADLLTQFPKAQQIAAGTFRFSVVPSDYMLEVRVAFAQRVVLVTALVTIEDSNGH